MNFKKGVLVVFIVLIVGSATMFAQSRPPQLDIGIYSFDDYGNNYNFIRIEAVSDRYSVMYDDPTTRRFTQFMGNSVVAQGTLTIVSGTKMLEVSGDYSVRWTIINSREFIDQGGKTWRWIRAR